MAPVESFKFYRFFQEKVDKVDGIGKTNQPSTKSTIRARVLPTLFTRVLPKLLKIRLSCAIFSQSSQQCERRIARNA